MATLAAGTAAASFGMAKFVQVGDKMQRMANNLRTVTTGASNLAEIQKELFDISQRSRVSMEGTVTLYARMARSTESLGFSQQKLLRITETVQKSFAVGGATTAEAMGAAIQLSQGIASDRFSGDEFRSVAENAPVLLREMAKQLGVNIGKLREMAHAGQLTGKVVTEAIYGASEAIDKNFGKTISTFEQGMVRLWNAVDQYVYQVDQSYGVTQTLASGINALADSFEDVAWWAEMAGIAMVAFAGGRIGGAAAKAGKGYLNDVAEYGLFARTRKRTKAELKELETTIKDIEEARKKIEQQIKDSETRFNDRAMRIGGQHAAAIKAAHDQEMSAHENLKSLESDRENLRARQVQTQGLIVAGLRKEQEEAKKALKAYSSQSTMAAAARFRSAGKDYGPKEQERDMKALAAVQERYRISTERLVAAERGVFDKDAVRAYGSEVNAIQRELNANYVAQYKAKQDILKAEQAYRAISAKAPEEAKKIRAELDRHRANLVVLNSEMDAQSKKYDEAIAKQGELNRRVTFMGAAMARVGGFLGSAWSLVGGGPGVAIMAAVGALTHFSSEAAKAAQRTKTLTDEMRELGFLVSEIEQKEQDTSRIDALLLKLSQVNAERAKMADGQWGLERLFAFNPANIGNLLEQLREVSINLFETEANRAAATDMADVLEKAREGKITLEEIDGILTEIGKRKGLSDEMLLSVGYARQAVAVYEALGRMQEKSTKDAIAGGGRDALIAKAFADLPETISGIFDELNAKRIITDSQLAELKSLTDNLVDGKISGEDFKSGLEDVASTLSGPVAAEFRGRTEDVKGYADEVARAREEIEKLPSVTSAYPSARMAEEESMRSIRAAELLMEEVRATFNMTEADKEAAKVKKDLIKVYDDAIDKYPEIKEAITAEEFANQANIETALEMIRVRELLNDAMSRQEKRAKDMTESLVQAAMDGKIGIGEMQRAMEYMAKMNPDLSHWINQIMGVVTAAAQASKELRRAAGEWVMQESKGGRVRVGSINLPDNVSVTPTSRVDPYFEDPNTRTGGGRKSDPYRDLIKSAQDRIDQMQLEIQLIGKHGVAQDVARFKLELLQKATDKGRKLDEKKRKEIEALTESYRKYATELATLTALEELDFEREQILRSPVERKVYEELRSIGLDINSIEGQRVADAVRLVDLIQKQKDEYEEIADIIGSSLADAFNGLFTGAIKDFDDFMDHITNGLARLATRQIDELFNFTEEGPWRRGAAANDNIPEMAGMIGQEVHKGAKAGTKEGSFGGTFEGLFTALGMSGGQSQAAGGALGAALGGFGMGYQSQDTLMGGLGGALSGAMSLGAVFPGIGHIAGAIIGGIAGAIGGILGKNKVKKEAQQELEKNRGAITSLIAIGEGTGIGEMTQLWRDYYDEVQEVTELAWKAGDMDLVKRVQSAFNQFFDRLYEDYQRSFDGMVESLRMGHGTSSPFVQAANEVTELRESLINLIADAEEMNRKHLELVGAAEDDWKVGRMADQIREMTEAAVDMARSFLLGAKELSAMESEVMRVDGAASALQITLEQLGKSAEEAAAIIEADTIQALDKLRRTFLSDVSLSMADLADMGFVAELVSAHDMYAMRLRDFAALGLDASLATQELNLRLAQIASQADLTDDHLRMLAGAFPQLSDGLLALIGGAGGNTSLALDNAKSALDQGKADLRSAYEAEIRLLEQVISRHDALIKSLQKFRDDLRLDSNLSPLDPYQRLLEAQKQYQETAALALTGDEESLGRLEDVSRAYLTEARSYYATSETYFRIFNEVEGILDQALALAGNQISEAEQQLAALKDLVSPLIDINDSVLTVADAINNLALAQAAADQAEAAHKASQDALLQQILGQLAASGATGFDPTISRLYQETVGRTPDAAGHAFWLNHLDQGYTADQIRQLMMQSPEYTALQGFSAGGFTGLGDLNQVMGVVHGREFVAHAEATRRWRPQLEMMNAGRDPFTSGNPVLVAELREEIRALRDEMRQNTQATVAGAQGQIAATEGTTNAVNRQIEGQWRKSRTRAA